MRDLWRRIVFITMSTRVLRIERKGALAF